MRTPGSALLACSAPPAPSSSSALVSHIGEGPLLCQTAAPAPLAMVGPCRGWDGGGSVEPASWLCRWCRLPPWQDLVSACASLSLALSLFPGVPPASLTSAFPHPALGYHLPFCYLHLKLCAGDFKVLFYPSAPFSSSLLSHCSLLSFFSPCPFQFSICAGSFSLSLFYN